MASITIKMAADTLSGPNVHAAGAVLGDGTPGAQAMLLCKATRQFLATRNIDADTYLALLRCYLTEPDREVG